MKDCPTLEQISSHCDCEDVPGMEDHLRNCESCRSAVSAFQEIDRRIQQESRPSPGLADLVLSACKEDACPSVEALSSYFDGDGLPGLEEHLEVCGACRAMLEDFRSFDELARESLLVPEGLAGRILSTCAEDPCPPLEALSEYYDGDRSPGLESHVEHCAKCQEILGSFARFDEEIQEATRVPETLVGGILKQVKANVCPDIASLSAYHDGGATVGLREHVEACGSCQQRLRQFAVFDSAAVQASLPPADLGTRILQAVGSGGDESPSVVESGNPVAKPIIVSFWRQNLARYAAAVVFTVGLGLLVVKNLPPSSGTSVAQKGQPAVPGVGIEKGERVVDGRIPRMQTYQATRPVTVNENGRLSSQMQKRQYLINENVHHIWLVDNPAEALGNLKKMLPLNAKINVSSPNKQNVTVEFALPEEKLQVLVDRVKKRNWSLVSSALPQPGEGDSVRFQKRNVLYTVELIKKED